VFAGLINEAKAAASGLLMRYMARASVVVPFAIALGFALAAITIMLVDRLGQVAAYWIMAAGLAGVGALAALAVSVKEEQEEKAEELAEQTDTGQVISDATAQAFGQAPIALLGTLAATPGGVTYLLPVVRVLARNFPLVLLLVMVGTLLFWPSRAQPDAPPDTAQKSGTEEDVDGPIPLRPVA
jgi:hypothetical protein